MLQCCQIILERYCREILRKSLSSYRLAEGSRPSNTWAVEKKKQTDPQSKVIKIRSQICFGNLSSVIKKNNLIFLEPDQYHDEWQYKHNIKYGRKP